MKRRLLLLFLLLLVPPKVMGAPTKVSRVAISGEVITTTPERIQAALPFQVGDIYDPKRVELGIHYLKQWGIFEKVEVQTKETIEGMVIQIHLQEGPVISEIDIRGNYPYITTKIRKRLTLQVGEILQPQKLEEQKKRIKKFYERKGYFNTQVFVKTEPAAAKNSIRLIFEIKKGGRLRYNQIEFLGVESFLEGRMHSFITHMDIYSKKRLKTALNNIVQFYRDHGFLKAKARVIEESIDWEKRRVNVTVEITEGPKVKVFFRGNPPYRLSTLRKTVTLYREGNFDSVELKLSAEALVKKLKSDGYMEPKVAYKRRRVHENLYHVYFNIKTGPRRYIYSIDLKENKAFSDSKLKQQMLTKEHSFTQKGVLNESFLTEDQKLLTKYYQSRGFLDAVVETPKIELTSPWRYDLQILVQEGEELLVNQMQLVGQAKIPKENLLKKLTNQEGKPLNETALPLDQEQVEFFYADQGYPYAEVDQEILREGKQVTIRYQVEEGPLVKIGDILFVGDVLTGVRAMRQAIKMKPGDTYSRQKVIQAGLNLRRLGPFRTVDVETIGLDEKETTVLLKINVEERFPFVLDVDFQYSTDTRYSGATKFTNYNSFGWAKQTRLTLIGGVEKDRAEVSWLDPRFLGSDVQMTIASWLDFEEQPTEKSLQAGGSFSFFRLFRRFGFLGRYQLTRSYIFSGQAIDPSALRDSILSEIDLSASYDTRDSFADPTKGFFSLLGIEFFDEIGGLEANFAKLRLSGATYVTPVSRLTWSNSFRLERIQNIGKNVSVPQRELLVLGGDDTVRGFREDRIGPLDANGNPVGGRVRIIHNSEFDIRLGPSLQLGLFLDTGSLSNSFPELSTNSFRHAAGFGLRYVTPIGPIRADYGIILDRRAGENFGRFHLTFGHPL